jgi:signal transduction histidine kinase
VKGTRGARRGTTVRVMDRRFAPGLRRAALDWVGPVAILAIGLVDVFSKPHSTDYPGSPWRHLAFLAIAVALLGLRRHAPLLAPCAAIVVVTWWTSLWPPSAQGPFAGFLLLVGAAYSLGTLKDRRNVAIGGAVLAAWFVLGLFVGIVGGRAGDVVPIAVWIVVGFGVGYLISRRTEQARLAVESARVLAVEQEQRTARAIEDERARIARELHDVVAHHVSVIGIQAAASRRVMARDPQAAVAALGSVEESSREAVAQMRSLVGALRDPADGAQDTPEPRSPDPGWRDLARLVDESGAPGLEVAYHLVESEPGAVERLPVAVGLSVFRIVQESLTNVRRHSTATAATVVLRVEGGGPRPHAEVEVTDNGRPRPGTSGSGLGLLGVRERAASGRGEVEIGPRVGGGYRVRVRFPLELSRPQRRVEPVPSATARAR